jgi:hypothetical protein
MILTGGKAKYWEKKPMAIPLYLPQMSQRDQTGPKRSEAGDYPEPCMAIKD